MKRIYGRLVHSPAMYRGSKTGFNYRDITAERISFRYCRIDNENLNDIKDWGTLKTPQYANWFIGLWFKLIHWRWDLDG